VRSGGTSKRCNSPELSEVGDLNLNQSTLLLQAFQDAESMAMSNDFVRELTTGLTRELELRSDPSAAGPSSGSQSMRTTLQEKKPSLILLLQTVLSKTKPSPLNANSSAGFGRGFVGPRGSNGLSPSQSGSSDSSMSGGGPGHFGTTSRNTETAHLTGSYPESSTQVVLNRQKSRLPLASTIGNRAGAGRGSGNVNGGGARTPNSQMCLSTIGRGKNPSSSASGDTGCPTAKEPKPKKKRKRASKKPPTENVYTTPEQFQSTVQRLTGFKSASLLPTAQLVEDPLPTAQLVRPQPERPQPIAVAVRIEVDKDSENPPARPDAKPEATPESLPPAMVTSVACASSSASDRAPETTVSDNSGTSSSRSEIMNITFGYGQTQFPFALEEHQHQHQHLNPPDYEEPDDYEVYDADRMPAPYEGRATTSRSSFEPSQVSESDKKEGVSSGPQRLSGSKSTDSWSGSAMLYHSNPSPSDGLKRRNRPPREADDIQMEDAPDFSYWGEWIDHLT
jgi:hypothetical protein